MVDSSFCRLLTHCRASSSELAMRSRFLRRPLKMMEKQRPSTCSSVLFFRPSDCRPSRTAEMSSRETGVRTEFGHYGEATLRFTTPLYISVSMRQLSEQFSPSVLQIFISPAGRSRLLCKHTPAVCSVLTSPGSTLRRCVALLTVTEINTAADYAHHVNRPYGNTLWMQLGRKYDQSHLKPLLLTLQ